VQNLAPIFDAQGMPDPATLTQLKATLTDIGREMRWMSNSMLHHFITVEEQARANERALLFRFMVQSLVLLLLMVVSLYLAVSLWRDLERRTKQTERAEATLAKAFQSALSAVIVTDREGEIILSNGGAEEIFGYSRRAMAAMHCQDLIDITTLVRVDQDLETVRLIDLISDLAGHAPVRATARRGNGEVFPIDLGIMPDVGVDGRPNLIWFVRDISSQVRAEERLRTALSAAQRHAAAKSMFLATMSHEMRTPLHGLIASLELIDGNQLDDKNRKFLKTAADCSERALAQVNDVLELTRLGETAGPEVPFAPAQVAADIIEELEALAGEKGNELLLDVVGEDLSAQFMGRAAAFSRTMYNLTGNAVKFTQGGTITIRMTFAEMDDASVQLFVSVTDTGVGIAPDDQERVLEQFETVGRSEVNAVGGTGLGLPIAKLAVEGMGGKLALDSELGKGSCFSFDIPLHRAPEDAVEEAELVEDASTAMLNSGCILVVDDNDVNLTVLSEMVRRLGFSVEVAHNGAEAVEMARARLYTYILMDVSMPVMDGREATRKIRKGGACADAVIIGVTALMEARESSRLKAAGMNAVLNKPVKMQQLKEMLVSVEAEEPEEVASADDSEFEELCGLVGSETALRLLSETFQDVRVALEAMVLIDTTSVERIHRAVGAAGMVGLVELSDFLSEAELAAAKGRQEMLEELAPDIRDLLAEAERRYAQLCSAT
jgi:PAS domain S-box-containing protein